MSNYDDINTEINMGNTEVDSFRARLFKNKTMYKVEGYIICGNKYGEIVQALTKSFEEIKAQFYWLGKEKKLLIDELLQILKQLKNAEPSEERDTMVSLCKDCLEVFQDDIKCLEMEDMQSLSFDKNFLDWRYAYGISEKN